MDEAQVLMIEIDRLAREIRMDALQEERVIPSWADAKAQAAAWLARRQQPPSPEVEESA